MLTEDYEEISEAFRQQGNDLSARDAEISRLAEDKSSLSKEVTSLNDRLDQAQADFQRRLSEVEAQMRLANDSEMLTVLQAKDTELALLKSDEAGHLRQIAQLKIEHQTQADEIEKFKVRVKLFSCLC